MMEKIGTGRGWTRVAATNRVNRIKRQKEDTPFYRHQQQLEDEAEEKQAETPDAGENETAQRKTGKRRKKGRQTRIQNKGSADENGDDHIDAQTGRRIDIRV